QIEFRFEARHARESSGMSRLTRKLNTASCQDVNGAGLQRRTKRPYSREVIGARVNVVRRWKLFDLLIDRLQLRLEPFNGGVSFRSDDSPDHPLLPLPIDLPPRLQLFLQFSVCFGFRIRTDMS